MDPAVEAAQARLDAMRTGRYQASTSKQPKKPALTVSDKTKLDKSSILDYRSVNSNTTSPRKGRGGTIGHYTTKSDTSMTPLPPPMVSPFNIPIIICAFSNMILTITILQACHRHS